MRGPIHDYAAEERWCSAWLPKIKKILIDGEVGGEGSPGLVRWTVFIAMNASREQLESFLPFMRLIMRHFPSPKVSDGSVQKDPDKLPHPA